MTDRDRAQAGEWGQELARAGELRFPPRRNLMIRRLVVIGLVAVGTGSQVVSAVLGRSEWLWWPVFCAVLVPFAVLSCWQTARSLSTGRPVLVVDRTGVALGDEQLTWAEVTAISVPKARFLQGLQSIGVTAAGHRLDITEEHVKELTVFGHWLEHVWQQGPAPDA
jgi:hypothetical protein